MGVVEILSSMILGFLITTIFVLVLGESPIHVFGVLFNGAFGSLTGLGYSLFYATPIILTGLSVSWAFRIGLFNIGGEGQMALGGIAMAAVSLQLAGFHPLIVWFLSLLAGFFVGGAWALIAGWLKAYRGAHEVLCTILLNYVAYGIVSYLISYPMRNVESQAPETLALSSEYQWMQFGFFGGTSPLNMAFAVSIFLALLVWFLESKSLLGIRQKQVGDAPGTALRTGISIKKQILLGMFLSGGLAGLAGFNEFFGYSLKIREGFTAGAGFLGIAVTLLGRNHPVGIVLAGIFFGALQKGALDLDIDTQTVTRDLAQVIQSVIILSVVSQKGWKDIWNFLRTKWNASWGRNG